MAVSIQLILFYLSALAFALVLAFCIILIAVSRCYPLIIRSSKEEYFVDPTTNQSYKFPSIDDESSLNLSVIIPAYNEENRLPPMLDECIGFLEERCKSTDFKYEIIVVSDGSRDKTVEIANNYCKKLGVEKFRVLGLEKNRGKGGAVRLGMFSARGALLLFADADGATKFPDITKLEDSLKLLLNSDYLKTPNKVAEKVAISIGSRAHLEEESIANRTFLRTILMYGFHFLVWLFAVRTLKDTQCGFKLFTRKAAKICFESVHIERWAFDVELLYIAEALRIPVTEIPVNWTEIDGSKLTPVWSWIQMGRDLGLIWLRYTIGAWKIKSNSKI